jgi:hypothetical protein
MEYRVDQTARGWIVIHAEPDVDRGPQVAGPFSDRQQAVDWILQQGQSAEREQQLAAAEVRADRRTLIVADIAKEFACSTDFVRKCRKEYAPIAGYDTDLLTQLRAQALERRSQVSVLGPSARPSALDEAREFLLAVLAMGPVLAEKVYQDGKIAGHSARTPDRAKKLLAIISVRTGKGWAWALPHARVPTD